MQKFYKKGLALLLMMGAASSAFALEMTFNLNRIPDSYSDNYSVYYYSPVYKQGKAVLSGNSYVDYRDDTGYKYVYVEDGRGKITITNLPFISYYDITYHAGTRRLTTESSDAFKLVIVNGYPTSGSYGAITIKSIKVTYGVNFIWNNFRYSLLTDETAQVERCANSSEIIVPSTLPFAKEGWYDVTVTTVFSKAFANLSNLTKITLPTTIESIGSSAFLNSPNRATVVVQSITPPTLPEYAFDANEMKNVAVYVPAESYSAYKSAEVWKDLNLIPSGDAVAVDGIEYNVTDGMALVTAFDSDAETVAVPSTVSIDGKDYIVALGLMPGNSYPNLKSIYIGEDVAIQSLSSKNAPNLNKMFYLGTSAPSVTTGAMTSLSGRGVQVYGVSEESVAGIVEQTKGTERIYPMMKNRFTADGIMYIPTSTAGRTCDAVDYDYATVAPVIGETASYRNVVFTIKNINPYIFYAAKSIESITVNNTLALPSNFASWTNVSKIDLTCGDIPAESFMGSANLSKLTINTKGNIGESAFAKSATKLTSKGAEIEINNEGTIESNAFLSFGPIDRLHVGKNVTAIKASAFEGAFAGDADGVVELEFNGAIGDKAFYNAHNIKSLTVAESVTGIGAEAFRYAMTGADATVTLNNSGTIAEDAFRNNTALVNAVIGNGCTAIEATAFAENVALKEVAVGYGCVSIADQVFANNAALEKVVLGDAVKTVGNELLINDTALKDVTVGSGLTSLGNYVFDNCEAMATITVKAVEPPTCGTYDFCHIDTWSCELLVPRASVDAYAVAPQWEEFMNLSAYFDPNEVTDIIIDPESGLGDLFANGLELFVNDSKEIAVKIMPDTADAELKWSSSDEAVASVDSGLVSAVGAGEAVITVSAGDISRSFTVKVSKREQTIAWEQELGGLKEGDTVELTATATSELPVQYSVIAGQAAISDATLSIDGVGEITVEASQPGNNEYLPAEAVRKSFNAMSGVDAIEADGTLFRVEGNELVILSGDYSLYDLRGLLLEQGIAPARIALQADSVYILRVNDKNIKLIMR